jgi:hypothetical protein
MWTELSASCSPYVTALAEESVDPGVEAAFMLRLEGGVKVMAFARGVNSAPSLSLA